MTAIRHFQLTEQQQQELRTAYEQCKHGPMRTRLLGVRLYGSGYAVKDISEIIGHPRRTVLRWCARYRRDGIDGLEDQRKGGNRALLSEAELQAVCHKLHQYRPVDVLGPAGVATASGQHWTVPDLKQALKQWQGLVYQSRHSYRELFQLPTGDQGLSLPLG
ncbi:MAG TPA: helix-turn-helix domain-containing protein [candidate division Zixibacteria bacterium]|nr:helix-turn-helix domain-containing protein [candidate division Zixibacteria bacterium]